MCHYPVVTQTKRPVYNNPQQSIPPSPVYRAPVYRADSGVNNTYWRLFFFNSEGVEKYIIMKYNNGLDQLGFLDSIRNAVRPYGVHHVDSATIMVPAPRPANTPSHMQITDQRHFNRAMAFIPRETGLYNSMGGIPVRVDCKAQQDTTTTTNQSR
ncbi:unnamed protein product [Mucor hiemalis]